MEITPAYLTERQVAQLLGVGTSTLAKGRSWGTIALPYSKFGRSVRYSRADVEKFMAAHRIDPIAKQGPVQ